ncbi:MAG: tRNA (adenosine(37)-N6)-threonylcarbamoyltransferase complex dimerization subunit type 1 TsaB [Ignavibacteria bacterium]|nr:tRNA (adenosine(37)-N6)-threonylcarbamoyltransferase complex dimerization subunit type 1 TsaB [Ignavibacteria bacterium]
MNILLLNTATYDIEFGYYENGNLIIEKSLLNEGNADLIIFYIYESFRENRRKIKEIDAVSLVNGPGSFTGIRVGSAIAKGICLVTNSLFYEINTLDLICNKYKEKVSHNTKVIPLIPANTKENEFYFAEYIIDNNKIKRVSDYQVNKLENIANEKHIYLINEDINFCFPQHLKLENLKNYSNIKSQYDLTKEKILNNEYTDFRTSEPFYIKKFTPIKKQI